MKNQKTKNCRRAKDGFKKQAIKYSTRTKKEKGEPKWIFSKTKENIEEA